MAHFILEYSDNLNEDELSIQSLFQALHQAAETTRLFPLKGLRSRAYPCKYYRMADGNPSHSFVHLEVKLGFGRSLEDRKNAANLFFNTLNEHFSKQMENRGIALSFEMKELEEVLKFNRNNIENHL